ncbi:bifunctional diguanylate cyclase/phosphodiesterase [Sphingosinicella soli]|uniref:Diguanylate cyclase (GGDEF)-like protein n=1 Tax=Sphingosinicella soli TaxID=333708 RepID=A0A7W7B227_9SPHN|nr:EAL domain-containing protein [Sphingosinicella soli]MBB4631653.1 diguanylate cyclase (GGDEF)-like protein [Sphingosinicella soli]
MMLRRITPQFRFHSLRLRIAATYAGLFTVTLTAILLLAGDGIARFGETSASRDLAANARVFDEIIELRAKQMRGAGDVLSRDFGFRQAVATSDRPTIESALVSLRRRSGSDAAFIVGLDGEMVGSADGALPPVDALWSALDAGEERGILLIGGQPALAAASAIEAPDIIGWLVLAQSLDATEMNRLRKLAAIDINARVVRQSEMRGALARAPRDGVFEGGGDERILHYVTALPSIQKGVEPRLVLDHSLSKALGEYSGLQWLLVSLAAAGLALVMVLSWPVARSITRPLSALDKATHLVGEGQQARVEVSSDDEIGRLGASFNVMVAAIEERERQITHVALHDTLTGLPNRRLFGEQIDHALARRRGDTRLMVVYVDLDDFKVVNDTLGHPAGDTLLRNVAAHLQDTLDDAIVARLGGDEFAILMSELPANANLAALAEKLQACFDRSIMIEGQQAETSASMGIAIAPEDGTDRVTLMKNADLALYRAKHDGKGMFHFFEPSLDVQARQRREMELDLRTAIREGGFELYFQPLYSLKEDRLKAFEALIRWPHPEKGMISPADFIPLAEDTGLIVQIGEWVIREACHQAASWPGDLSVAVNVSPKQFLSPNIAGVVMSALASSGLPATRLELEITESIFISNVEKTLGALHSLRALGVRIALDDFGTGYSSLSYLRSFPFDKLKIDQSFVRDLTQDASAHAVIRAITTLADALGMETLAEGVEDEAQAEILRKEGCRQIQGYWLSRPIDARATQQYIERMRGEAGVLRRTA